MDKRFGEFFVRYGVFIGDAARFFLSVMVKYSYTDAIERQFFRLQSDVRGDGQRIDEKNGQQQAYRYGDANEYAFENFHRKKYLLPLLFL